MLAPATSIVLTAIQQGQIEKLTRDGGTPQRVAARYRIILLARQGKTNVAIAGQLGLSRPTVLAAHAAFAQNGLNAIVGVRKRKRSARVLTPELTQRILDATLKTRPLDGSTHWSVRMLAKHLGVSRTITHRVWQKHDVQPHRVERFKISIPTSKRRFATLSVSI